MVELHRRAVLKLAAAGALALPAIRASAQAPYRVVVVGGGFGGATVARTLRRLAPDIDVTLIERDARFVTCPFSNAVLGGLRDLESITFGYEALQSEGVHVVIGEASGIDPDLHEVTTSEGATFAYDRLILSPGIQLDWEAIPGYDRAAAEIMPHAWLAGPQTTLLASQLRAMPDGGTVIIAPPDNPYRCPPGPYERASLIAYYLSREKPASKIIILDAKEAFSKQGLFAEAWNALYPGMVEWIPASATGTIVSVDAAAMTVTTDFDEYRGDVINIIPPQRAAPIALQLGLDAGNSFCPVNPHTFESTIVPNVHLLGDSIIAGAMPKSGFSANSQAKACAEAIVAIVRGGAPSDPVLLNTCYSLASPDYGFSVAGAYRAVGDQIVSIEGTGGTSPVGAPLSVRSAEAAYAASWYHAVTQQMFASG